MFECGSVANTKHILIYFYKNKVFNLNSSGDDTKPDKASRNVAVMPSRNLRSRPAANVASTSQNASSSSEKAQNQHSLGRRRQSNENPTEDKKEDSLHHSSAPLPMNDATGQQNNTLRVDKETQTNMNMSESTLQQIIEMDLIIKDLHGHFKEARSLCKEVKQDIEEGGSGLLQDRKRPAEEAGPSQKKDVNQSSSDPNMVPIGYGNAIVHRKVLENINWSVYTEATRRLLRGVFPRSVLATHSLSGKKSPAFPDRPPKKMLDPDLVEDIMKIVSDKCEVSRSSIRNCISSKCAQEAQIYRRSQMKKDKPKKTKTRENKSPSASLSNNSLISDYDGDGDGDDDGDDDDEYI